MKDRHNRTTLRVLGRAALEGAGIILVIWAIRALWGPWAGFVPSTSGEPLLYLLVFFVYTIIRGIILVRSNP